MSAPPNPWEIRSRRIEGFDLKTATHRHRYEILERATVDDIMGNMARAEAHLTNTGEDLTYLPSKDIIDYLVKTNVALEAS